jgi:hypothetical protein
MFPSLEYVLLQVRVKKKGQDEYYRPARNWTKTEFISHMTALIDCVHAKADEQGLGDVRWRFAFDNPNNHNIKRADLPNLRAGEKIIRPPRYSPELMQAIEHSHGYTQKAYLASRMEAGAASWDIQAEWRCIRDVFFAVNTPAVVTKTVGRVQEAARQIIKAKGGRIAREYR